MPMDVRHRIALVVAMAALAVLPAARVARADIIPNSVISLSTTNERWQHASYFVTDSTSAWHGASATMKASGLSLDGFDDQNEVSLTVYADKRYGEVGNGNKIFPTFALAIMRNWRLRDSVWLKSDPDHIDVFTLSTAARTDRYNGLYVYARATDGATLTIKPNESHRLEVRYSGAHTYVYNRDSLTGQRPIFSNGVPRYTDWLDISDSSSVKGHLAYRWDAVFDGRVVRSAWLASDKGRVKFESNKRHLRYAQTASRTDITGVKLAASAGSSGATSYRSWDRSVRTLILTTKGCYLMRTVWPCSTMYAYVPSLAEVPKANFAKSSNSIAYDLKSFQTTRFTAAVDRPNVWATLTIRLPVGIPDKVIYDGPIAAANTTVFFPLWGGLTADGKRLSSANYDWELRLTKGGLSNYYTGKITVCRVRFVINGSSLDGVTRSHAMYMIPGSANCYIAARSEDWPDRVGIGIAGPNGYRASVAVFDLGDGSTQSRTSYLRSGSVIRSKGTYVFEVTGARNVAYGMTVIQ